MSYSVSISLPRASPVNGVVECIQINQEISSFKEASLYAFSTIGYPLVAIISFIAWASFSLSNFKHRNKCLIDEHKIDKIKSYNVYQINLMVTFRLQKLHKREQSLHEAYRAALVDKALGRELSVFELENRYAREVEVFQTQAGRTFQRSVTIENLEKRLVDVQRYLRVEKEISLYERNIHNSEYLREKFIYRLEFSHMRHRLANVINQYFLEMIYLSLKPVVGLKQALDYAKMNRIDLKESLLQEYNQKIKKESWVKPYMG